MSASSEERAALVSDYVHVSDNHLWLWCPGCDDLHHFDLSVWTWDGSVEAPTLSPSLLVHRAAYPSRPGGTLPQCHSFVRDGRWQFLDDSEHDLAGQTVPLAPLPGWATGTPS